MTDELREAAERWRTRRLTNDEYDQWQDDADTLADWAVQQLTAPADVEAELRAAAYKALEHVIELRDAWHRGCIDERDGKGGTRSNRNAEVEISLRNALLQRGRQDDREVIDRIEKHAHNALDHLRRAELYAAEKSMSGVIVDCKTIKRRRADDGEATPITKKRAIAAGFERHTPETERCFRHRLSGIELFVRDRHSADEYIRVGGIVPRIPFTMQALGRLCAALGVPLNESTNTSG